MTNRYRWFIDKLLPPIVSDSRWFNWLLARIMYGNRPFDLDFKEKADLMSDEEFQAAYQALGRNLHRRSDTTAGQQRFPARFLFVNYIINVSNICFKRFLP
ncbi:MAG: hypothetical protein ACFCD0_30155 [Gemmataceae bacterium]